MMNKEDKYIEEYTSNNISKFWYLLNNSNDISEKQKANIYFSNLKEKCNNYLDLSIELFNKSNSLQDKLISSILIYQYIKEHYGYFIDNQILYNNTKNFLINNALISFTNIDIFNDKEISLIIEKICYSISIILLLGCINYWQNGIEDILSLSKETINHIYLATIILGNCGEELYDLFLTKSQENKIKEKFVNNKDNFKLFINSIIINSSIDKKLYNKTIILAKNLIIFEVNILQIPKMIKIILENINISNIDSISKLISKCIDYSNSKKLEDDLCGLDLIEYDNKMDKNELSSINLIIEYIYIYINNIFDKKNNDNRDIIFGLAKFLGDITENYIYLMFKKDDISQKLLTLFFFFISNKSRIISQLFFESTLIMKNFINACYKFSNYSNDEKVEFSKMLLKIYQSIIFNCTYKKLENQEILMKEKNISINYNKKNENEEDSKENDKNEEDELNEISINEYRINSEDAFYNIFLIIANNFLIEGVNYFFETIINPIIPLLSKNISDISILQILSIESIIYSIKSIINSLDTLIIDKAPLMQFISLIMKSNVINHDFIFSNFLLLIEEASTFFDYNKIIFTEIISFLIENINKRINDTNKKSIVQLNTAVLLSICESCENFYNNDILLKLFLIYKNYYNIFNEIALYNVTESLCTSLISLNDKNIFMECFKNILEIPLINIKNINEIKKQKNEKINKEKEELIKSEIQKNFNVITRIFKQISFIEDKSFLNNIFDIFYSTSFSYIFELIKEYISFSEIIKPFLKMLTKTSMYFNKELIDKIFINMNQFLIEIFLKNNENYQSIYAITNIYKIKLKNIDKKIISNNEYNIILDNFIGLNRQICSTIINRICPQNQLDLILTLSTLFNNIFPLIQDLRKDDYIIICDTIIIFIEAIKTICDNIIIKNIFNSFTCFIKCNIHDLIKLKFKDIILATFLSLENYNNDIIVSFVNFCFESLKYEKSEFMNILNQILCNNDFNFLDNKYKKIIYEYINKYCNDFNKIKNIIFDFMNISKKINVPEILEEYNNELINQNNDYFININ